MAATLYHDIMSSKDCEGQWAVWKWAGHVQPTKHVFSCPLIRKNPRALEIN